MSARKFEFFSQKVQSSWTESVKRRSKNLKIPKSVQNLAKTCFQWSEPKIGPFYFKKSRLNPFSPRVPQSGPLRDPTLLGYISGTKRLPEQEFDGPNFNRETKTKTKTRYSAGSLFFGSRENNFRSKWC